MFRRLRYLWALLAAAAAAVLLRGLAAALPCPATEVLSPINESPWELGKLVFWPYLAAALLLWRLEPLESASRGGHCAALLAATALMVLLCRFLWGVLPLWLLFCGAAAGAMALYHFLLLRRLPGGELLAVVSAGHPVGGCLSAVDGAAPDRRYFPRPP